MRTRTHDLAVYVGRFQGFHDGHAAVLKHAATISDTILILVGSSYRPRSGKNPWSFPERRAFIEAAAKEAGITARLIVLPLVDTLYNDRAWCANVRAAANIALRKVGIGREARPKIAILGCEKDSSSAYLRWFPDWDLRSVDPVGAGGLTLHATGLRAALFFPQEGQPEPETIWGAAPVAALREWMAQNPDAVARVQREAAHAAACKQAAAAAEKIYGYPIPVNTVDAVVVQSGHVLTIRRGALPGQGLVALPGGHIDPGETALDAAIREIYEEVRLDMPRGALLSRLRARQVFDHPHRSERGWVRTECFLFELEDRPRLEKVKGGSDAAAAFWTPLAEVDPSEMFEDHFDILQTMVPETPFAYASLLMAHA